VSDPAAGLDAVPAPAPRTPKVAGAKRTRAVLALVVIAGALSFLVVKGLTSALNFYDTVDEAMHHRGTLGTSTFNLEGTVAKGSIHATAVGTNFDLTGDHATVHVENVGSPPQLFQADIPVVVTGHFTSPSSMVFDSTQILVKHSSTYIAAHPGRVKAADGSVR
jgi:cytochrome c-type biogenesis protein CcmE